MSEKPDWHHQPAEDIWRQLVARALKGGPFDRLSRYSDDDILIEPIYQRTERGASLRRATPNTPWIVVQRTDDPDPDRANESLSADLAGGAGGVELVFAGGMSAERTGFGLNALDGRMVASFAENPALHLRLDGGPSIYEHCQRLAGIDVSDLTIACDPLANAAALGAFDPTLAEIEKAIADATRDLRNAGRPGSTVIADGRIWAAGGASEVQEIAGILGSIAHHTKMLAVAGLTHRQALDSVGICVDAGAHQLRTMAKIRALRLCHARIAEVLNVTPQPARIHAETSWRMMTRYDVHTNILRAVSAVFAAGVAGADSITVLPFTCTRGLSNGFARRVARNLQIVLLEESKLARVDDPGAGSGAIETLTASIAAAAWEKFTELEAAGGLAAALRAGTFQRDIANMRRRRDEKIRRREFAITGVSTFPALGFSEPQVIVDHAAATPVASTGGEEIPRLAAIRFAEPFEALRDRAAELAEDGRPPRIFLAKLGTSADFSDPAQAAANFFAAGGIRAGGEAVDPTTAAEAFRRSGAAAACIAGVQSALEQAGAETAAALKAAGAKHIYVMGGEASGEAIDAVLHDSVDAIAVLTEVLATT